MGSEMCIRDRDITVAYALYQNAVKMGLGTKAKLWDKPLWE